MGIGYQDTGHECHHQILKQARYPVYPQNLGLQQGDCLNFSQIIVVDQEEYMRISLEDAGHKNHLYLD
jgi:hypothetical protein